MGWFRGNVFWGKPSMLGHKIDFLGSTKMVNFQLLLGVNFDPW
jgi:hypothetical protein